MNDDEYRSVVGGPLDGMLQRVISHSGRSSFIYSTGIVVHLYVLEQDRWVHKKCEKKATGGRAT